MANREASLAGADHGDIKSVASWVKRDAGLALRGTVLAMHPPDHSSHGWVPNLGAAVAATFDPDFPEAPALGSQTHTASIRPSPHRHGITVATMAGPRQLKLTRPVVWGLVWGGIQAASPLAFWWLDTATVYALGLALIASVYIGFAVADGRPAIIGVESSVAALFVVVAAAAVTGSPWLLVLGLAGHGLKDLWQHRTQFVANTRWWPPFCLVVDWTAAAVITVEILAGVRFHH